MNALALLKLLATAGNTVRMPHSKPLGAGLFELREGRVRLFSMFRPGRRVVLLEGLIKKRADIPSAVLKRVRKYQRTREAAEAREVGEE